MALMAITNFSLHRFLSEMTYEKVRQGNPLQLTINQHFHSAYAIEKFHDHQNTVQVRRVRSEKVFKASSTNKIFCAKRNWDERAEKGYMSSIERAFHEQIDQLNPRNARNHRAISSYFLLWSLRHRFHCQRLSDAPLQGVAGESLTKTEQEILEKNGFAYVNEKGEVPSRQITGTQIQIGIDQHMPGMEVTEWGLLEAKEGEFLCADAYHKILFIPISPKYAFAGNNADKILTLNEVANLNKLSLGSATEFYFSRDLDKCPIF